MKIAPANSIRGEVRLPGDKSISHRAVMLASIANGTTRIDNFSTAEDCHTTIECMRQLGVRIENDGSVITVNGVGKHGLSNPPSPLDCGNSGTTIRLLSGILAGQRFESVLTGDESLMQRPMGRVVEPLRSMGAEITADANRPPITISPSSQLKAIEFRPEIASAQVKSCVLLAGLYTKERTSVYEKVSTRDHTELMLDWLDGDVTSEGGLVSVGSTELTGRDIFVPADISAAAFFIVAAAILPGSRLTMRDVGTNPTRTALLDVLRSCGVEIEAVNERRVSNEQIADLAISGTSLNNEPLRINEQVAGLIDEIPILAVLGTRLEHGIEVRGASELRVKESDRIASVVENLRRMGAVVEEFPDGFRVGRSSLHGCEIDSFGDHRIAMAFSIAGLVAEGETTILGAECVDISFPGFFETLTSVVM